MTTENEKELEQLLHRASKLLQKVGPTSLEKYNWLEDYRDWQRRKQKELMQLELWEHGNF